MGKAPSQSRPGVCCWRLRAKQSRPRFVGGRLLPWRGSRICCPRKSRIYSGNPPPGLRENQTSEDLPLSLRESSRGRRRAVGTGTHSGEDEGMHLADARGRRSDRVLGMDGGQSLKAYKVHSTTRRQRPEKGSKGGLKRDGTRFVLLGLPARFK